MTPEDRAAALREGEKKPAYCCDHDEDEHITGNGGTAYCHACSITLPGGRSPIHAYNDSQPTYHRETGAGGHCLDTDAEHWYDGEACGHCSAEWVDD